MDWKSIVATVAPGIAMALGGPLAGVAVGALGKALLGDEAAAEDTVANAVLQANPEALAKVKKAEIEFQAKMKELDIDLERVHAGDRDSARGMARATSLVPQATLGVVFIAGFIVVLWAVFTNDGQMVDENNRMIVVYLLGILSAGLTQIMNFFFGSSSGSKQKTAILARSPA